MIDQLISILIQSSWQILGLSLIVWPLSRLSKRAYPKFAYILWVVILIKALIPINIAIPTQQIPVVVLSPVITGQFIQETSMSSGSSISLNIILAALWGLGVLFLGMRLFLSESTHRKRMRRAEKLSPEPWFEDMKADLGLRRPIHLYMSENIQSPLMQGLWNVRIYLPQEYPSWALEEKQSLLAHELTHVQRLDILVIYLQAIVRTLYFFHPIIWLVNDQIDLEREKICDDEAIEISRTDRGAYGEQLFKQLSSERGERPVPVLAGGFFMSDSSLIKRFRYIKEKRGNMTNKLRPYHLVLITVVASVAIIIACSSENQPMPTDSQYMEKGPALNDNVIIQAYDVPPSPVGGYAVVQENVVYPELAKESGVGGTTIVQVVIDKEGVSGNAIVLKSAGDASLDAAAIEAVQKTIWNPAQNEGQPVSVRITMPIVFRLKTGDNEKSVSTVKPVGSQTWDESPRPADWKAISQNIIYPEQAKRDGITGTLTMQFTIDEKGNLLDPTVRSGPENAALIEAAIFALKSTAWIPASKAGEPISASMEMGIGFGTEDEQNKTQKVADGVRPLDRLESVPVTIKGPNAAEKAKDVSYKIYINSSGDFEAISGTIGSSGEDVKVDEEALDRWMKSKWEAIPRGDKLEGRWIDVPLKFTLID
ncbi:MAG: TonB family protein [Candidatus Marinimicrobia bacterium]|nr:TonB family protein [Candidatus Neomarinimicrobiota bacterium]